MSQVYSDPSRADETYSLPDVETFYRSDTAIVAEGPDSCFWNDGEPMPGGWFYWFCFPGCMPEGDPIGPFETEALAIEDAQKQE